jgi:hypothetical protein
MAERLAGINIREVNFDHRLTGTGYGVSQDDAGMGQTAWIDDDACRIRRLLLQKIDKGALMIGLEGGDLAIALGGIGDDSLIDLGQSHPAVDTRLTLAKRIEVGSVDYQNMQPGCTTVNTAHDSHLPFDSITGKCASTASQQVGPLPPNRRHRRP